MTKKIVCFIFAKYGERSQSCRSPRKKCYFFVNLNFSWSWRWRGQWRWIATMKKDCLSEVLRCWIEEIEERGRWLRAQLGPQPPNFPRYISSANVSTKCQREINKKRIWRSSHWKGLCADDFSLLLCTTVKKKRLYYVNYYPPRPNHYHFAEIILSLH